MQALEDPLERAFEESSDRIATILAGEPWADSTTRDVREVAIAAKECIDAEVAAAEQAVAAARARQQGIARNIRGVDRAVRVLGFETGIVRAERAAALEVERLQREADKLSGTHRQRLDRASADAATMVRSRERERSRWAQSRAVKAARRETHGNDLVRDALDGGDLGIRRMAEINLAAVRNVLLRQERIDVMLQTIDPPDPGETVSRGWRP